MVVVHDEGNYGVVFRKDYGMFGISIDWGSVKTTTNA
jgi:hypothetical protein